MKISIAMLWFLVSLVEARHGAPAAGLQPMHADVLFFTSLSCGSARVRWYARDMRIRGALPISQLVVQAAALRCTEGRIVRRRRVVQWRRRAKRTGAAQANPGPSDSSSDGSGDGGTGGDAILGANDSAVYSRFLTVHGVARQQ